MTAGQVAPSVVDARPLTVYTIHCSNCGTVHEGEFGPDWWTADLLPKLNLYIDGDGWHVNEDGMALSCQKCWDHGWCDVCNDEVHAWQPHEHLADGEMRHEPDACDNTRPSRDGPAAVTLADRAAAIKRLDATVPAGTVISCYTMCWPCQFGHHFDPPQAHTWMDDEDIHAATAGGRSTDPDENVCGCECAQPAPATPEEN